MSIDQLDRRDMAQLIAGQDRGLDGLMQRHGEKTFRFLLRMLGNEHEAAEITHEAFVRVFERKAQFNPNRRFSSWMFKIALNLARDRLRRIGRANAVFLEMGISENGSEDCEMVRDGSGDPSTALEMKEQGEMVSRAIEALPDGIRAAIILVEYEGLSHSQISGILGCSAKAVEMRVYRGRKELRKRLDALFKERLA